MATLSKPLVVPQYGNFHQNPDGSVNYGLVDQKPFTVNLFQPDAAGNPTLLASIDMTAVAAKIPFGVPPNTGFPDYVPSPNACAIVGEDLYVSVSAYQAQPGYTQLAAIV